MNSIPVAAADPLAATINITMRSGAGSQSTTTPLQSTPVDPWVKAYGVS